MTTRLFREGYNLIKWSNPSRERRRWAHTPKRSDIFPCPNIVRSFSDPVQSMADGKYYDDPESLRASYKAENNPHGVDFIEVGNEDTTKFTKPKRDRAGDRDAIDRAIAAVDRGESAPILTTDEFPI